METFENMNRVNVAQLPELPGGFVWQATSTKSSIDPTIIQTRLYLNHADEQTIVSWVNVKKGSDWVQNPSLNQLLVHAEGILSKTSTRWALGLPTEIEKPIFQV